jgi:hypothetical protein
LVARLATGAGQESKGQSGESWAERRNLPDVTSNHPDLAHG